jgi:hypothetical protein
VKAAYTFTFSSRAGSHFTDSNNHPRNYTFHHFTDTTQVNTSLVSETLQDDTNMGEPPPKFFTRYTPDPELQAEMKRAQEKYGFSSNDYSRTIAKHREVATRKQHTNTMIDTEERRKRKEVSRRGSKQSVDAWPQQALPSPASTGTPTEDSESPGNASIADESNEFKVPEWYDRIDVGGRAMKERRKKSSSRHIMIALNSLKDCLRRAEHENMPTEFAKLCNELRDHVHKAEFLHVDEYILKGTHMLENGLGRIFNPQGKKQFPWDLKADALQLYQRWADKVFSIDLLRGITKAQARGKDGIRSADRIDASWKGKYSSKYYGQGDLVIGQWWPTQLCTVRDGAHGSAQGGIWGEKEKGTYSIVLSSGSGYNDVDQGDEIWYTGTNSKDSTPTENTTRMIETADAIHEPIRVIRSSNLPKKNNYRPTRGFRYDGLYYIVGYRVLDAAKAEYQFHLRRCEGQDPIRWENKPSRRPTKWEIEEYDKLTLHY